MQTTRKKSIKETGIFGKEEDNIYSECHKCILDKENDSFKNLNDGTSIISVTGFPAKLAQGPRIKISDTQKRWNLFSAYT